jgi:hypothetical protein
MHSIEVQTEEPNKQKKKDSVKFEATSVLTKTPNAVYGMVSK